ncbi:hypothetical protein [Streptomyces wedmorensis]
MNGASAEPVAADGSGSAAARQDFGHHESSRPVERLRGGTA